MVVGGKEQGDRAPLFPVREAEPAALAQERGRRVYDPDVFRADHQGGGGGGRAGPVGERGEELGG